MASSSFCLTRLQEERKKWRKDHPFGFYCRPAKGKDGVLNLMNWEAGIPGRKDTPWEGGVYKLILTFSESYPAEPPNVKFKPPLFHPNVFASGTICLSILNVDQDWKPSISLKEILLGVQNLLDEPNLNSPAQQEAYYLYKNDNKAYIQKIKNIAALNRPIDE